MANLIKEQRLIDSTKRALVKYVFVSDGSADANVTMLDVSTLKYALNANGYIMTANTDIKASYKIAIKRIFGHIGTNAESYIKLQWRGTANTEIAVFGGSGPIDINFEASGDSALITNPEANSSGDIVYSTNIPAGGTFTLFLDIKKDAADFDAGQTADPTAFNNNWRI